MKSSTYSSPHFCLICLPYLLTSISNRAKYGYTTYRYLYAGNFSNIAPLPWLGATHSTELPLVFGTHYEYNHNSTELEWDTSYAMEGQSASAQVVNWRRTLRILTQTNTGLWLAFATDSSKAPTYNGWTWPEYSKDSDMAVFGSNTTALVTRHGSWFDWQCAGVPTAYDNY